MPRAVVGGHAARQQIGPVFGAVEVAHALVVRIQDHAVAGENAIRREREKCTARARIALHRGDRDLRIGDDDLTHKIVDRVDVAPRLLGRMRGGLDQVEVDPVRPEVRSAHQHDDPRRPRRRVAIRRKQRLALRGAHGTVVEGEVQIADGTLLLVADRPPGRIVDDGFRRKRRIGHVCQSTGEHHRRRKLEEASPASAFRWLIQTAPSSVARSIAPSRRAMTSPGAARGKSSRRRPSRCASYRNTLSPSTSSRTPGNPSAARILRRTVAVSSARQSIARSDCRIAGRSRPRTPGFA